eukprot:CAMPEP_0181371130 /NCGR_PEP_ID=MMETSP1106-20121128/13864_1 /TAXON_ID=81844 /ORGANISM="Mantoniella antarctica, Strain SL-175" /LENGTH=457 /DNA_ID=CAMNT_0023488107 /DNA_START=20 /DNA_END=1392 /DNA_ORIENTATION=-
MALLRAASTSLHATSVGNPDSGGTPCIGRSAGWSQSAVSLPLPVSPPRGGGAAADADALSMTYLEVSFSPTSTPAAAAAGGDPEKGAPGAGLVMDTTTKDGWRSASADSTRWKKVSTVAHAAANVADARAAADACNVDAMTTAGAAATPTCRQCVDTSASSTTFPASLSSFATTPAALAALSVCGARIVVLLVHGVRLALRQSLPALQQREPMQEHGQVHQEDGQRRPQERATRCRAREAPHARGVGLAHGEVEAPRGARDGQHVPRDWHTSLYTSITSQKFGPGLGEAMSAVASQGGGEHQGEEGEVHSKCEKEEKVAQGELGGGDPRHHAQQRAEHQAKMELLSEIQLVSNATSSPPRPTSCSSSSLSFTSPLSRPTPWKVGAESDAMGSTGRSLPTTSPRLPPPPPGTTVPVDSAPSATSDGREGAAPCSSPATGAKETSKASDPASEVATAVP